METERPITEKSKLAAKVKELKSRVDAMTLDLADLTEDAVLIISGVVKPNGK